MQQTLLLLLWWVCRIRAAVGVGVLVVTGWAWLVGAGLLILRCLHGLLGHLQLQ
jgi:hypothetical protein